VIRCPRSGSVPHSELVPRELCPPCYAPEPLYLIHLCVGHSHTVYEFAQNPDIIIVAIVILLIEHRADNYATTAIVPCMLANKSILCISRCVF